MLRSTLAPFVIALLPLAALACADDATAVDESTETETDVGDETSDDEVGESTDTGTETDSSTDSSDSSESDSEDETDSSTESDTGTPEPPPPPAYDEWIKIELPDTYCSDGSQYKFFVNWHEGADDIAVIFEPGGACWDYASCSGELGILGAANPNGIDDDHMFFWGAHSPLIRRDAPNNPMADWNLVFIPYCTGDVHTGSKTTVYVNDDETEELTYMHVGHDNMLEVVDYLGWMFPQTDRMYAGGCSAGGAGSQVNYYFLREALQPNAGYLVNDSGPLFPNSINSAPLHAEIRDVWGLDAVIQDTPIAASLDEDFGSINAELTDLFPDDRLAISYFVRDYNYSRYSYERFFDGIDKEGVHQKWWEDTELLMAQYDSHDNLAYYLPYYRFLNDSHCTTLFDFLLTDLGDMNVGDFVELVLDDEQPLQSFVDPDGSLGP